MVKLYAPINGPADTTIVSVPQIEEIRTIVDNGEVYFNAKDLAVAMKMMSYKSYPTLSVFYFVRKFLIELITARR